MNTTAWAISAAVLAVLLVALSAFYISGADPNRAIDYGRVCTEQKTSKDCMSWNLFKITYVLDKATETVTWYDGRGDGKITDCHITDTNNWWCDAGGTTLPGSEQNVIGFADAQSIENTPAHPATTTEHFSVLEYAWLTFR
jgi:hypothetical protein